MQNNTATILKQLNYEAIEAHLITYFIISFDERKDLTSKTSREIKLFVIEKVVKGNEETFNNFLKALEECEDVSNHQLMLKIHKRRIGSNRTLASTRSLEHTLWINGR